MLKKSYLNREDAQVHNVLRRLTHDESDDGDSEQLVDFFDESDSETCWTFTGHTPFLPYNKQHQSNEGTNLDPKPNFLKIMDGWKKIRLIFGLAELSR